MPLSCCSSDVDVASTPYDYMLPDGDYFQAARFLPNKC